MKKIIDILLFFQCILILGIGAGCYKIDNPWRKSQPATRLLSVDTPTVYSYILVNHHQVIDGVDSSITVSAVGAFSDSTTGNDMAINLLRVNNRTLTASGSYAYNFRYTDSIATTAEGLAFPGTTIPVKITGTSASDSITSNLYMPLNLKRYTTDFPGGQLNNWQDLNLTWVPDANNAIGQVGIEIFYYPGLSQYTDSTLPSSVSSLKYIVPDNGSYTIPAADMMTFPNNAYIGIQMARGTQVKINLPVSSHTVFIYAVNSVSSTPLLVHGCNTALCTGPDRKCIEGNCEIGTKVYTASEWDVFLGAFICTYHYEWSDATSSENYTEESNHACSILGRSLNSQPPKSKK